MEAGGGEWRKSDVIPCWCWYHCVGGCAVWVLATGLLPFERGRAISICRCECGLRIRRCGVGSAAASVWFRGIGLQSMQFLPDKGREAARECLRGLERVTLPV
ncbi:hypothetical protein A7L51_19125 [Acinetobacter baumannii]|nr:hypothetical protein A7L51_19125 [Acinetobacter baumannii]